MAGVGEGGSGEGGEEGEVDSGSGAQYVFSERPDVLPTTPVVLSRFILSYFDLDGSDDTTAGLLHSPDWYADRIQGSGLTESECLVVRGQSDVRVDTDSELVQTTRADGSTEFCASALGNANDDPCSRLN